MPFLILSGEFGKPIHLLLSPHFMQSNRHTRAEKPRPSSGGDISPPSLRQSKHQPQEMNYLFRFNPSRNVESHNTCQLGDEEERIPRFEGVI